MDQNHQQALFVAYYLARFNKKALKFFNYSTWTEAFNDIAYRLDVQKHFVKNWRDEFDPLFCHRAGWPKRPMVPGLIHLFKLPQNTLHLFKTKNGLVVND